MAAESRKEPEQEPAESLIDDLIRDILTDAGKSTKTAVRGPLAALMEVVTASPSRASRASMLERVLLAQTVASALADALAPALAEALAPEILRAMEHHTAGESPRTGEPVSAVGTGRRSSQASS
jgi:hypothetical protein